MNYDVYLDANTHYSWNETVLEERLKALGSADRKTHWIYPDLRSSKMSCVFDWFCCWCFIPCCGPGDKEITKAAEVLKKLDAKILHHSTPQLYRAYQAAVSNFNDRISDGTQNVVVQVALQTSPRVTAAAFGQVHVQPRPLSMAAAAAAPINTDIPFSPSAIGIPPVSPSTMVAPPVLTPSNEMLQTTIAIVPPTPVASVATHKVAFS